MTLWREVLAHRDLYRFSVRTGNYPPARQRTVRDQPRRSGHLRSRSCLDDSGYASGVLHSHAARDARRPPRGAEKRLMTRIIIRVADNKPEEV
jgi:hypothetical protein